MRENDKFRGCKSWKRKMEKGIERLDDQRNSLLRKKKEEAGWKRAAVIFYVFTLIEGGERQGNKEFRGGKLAEKKKNMARVSSVEQ